jgi:4-amino-4-deoxy-L-arabinose transferase-like glycosyltransferase
MKTTSHYRQLGILAVILLVALAVRLLGIRYGLPYVYFPDEAVLVNHAVGFGTGDLNPRYFIYPSLYMYLLFVIYGVGYVGGWLTGVFTSTNDLVRLFFNDPTFFYLPGRLIAAFSGALSVGVVYALGRRAYSLSVGLIGAAFLAFSVLHVSYSHYVKTHVPAGLLVIAGLWWAWSIYSGKDSWRHYLIAGLIAGLAASTIYHAGFVLISIIVAHVLRWRDSSSASQIQLLSPKILGAALASFVAFAITTPFAILDWSTFNGDIKSTASVFYQGGFWERGTVYPFTSVLDSIGWPVGFVCLVGLAYALVRRQSADIIVLSQPLFLGAFLMLFRAKEPQHMLIAFPALCILGASLLVDLISRLFRPQILRASVTTASTVLLLYAPAKDSFRGSYRLTLPDTRTLAKEWIERNVPPGSKIVMDSGKYYLSGIGPPLPLSRWTLEEFIARAEGSTDGPLARRVGTRRIGYTGEGEFFRQELKTHDGQTGFDIVQILHDAGAPRPDVLTLKEYVESGTQYAVVNRDVASSYSLSSEQNRTYPYKASKYRVFYRSLETTATLLKEFDPSETVQGPVLRIYRLQETE